MLPKPVDAGSIVESRQEIVQTGNERVRVATRPIIRNGVAIGLVQVGESLRLLDVTVRRMWQLLGAAAVGGGLISLLGGWWLSARLFREIASITRTAREIAETGQLSGRVKLRERRDEIGELVATLNAMLDRLERSARRQRDFLADVSHELRGPLTVIRGNLDLLRLDLSSQDRRESATEAMSELDRMHSLVDDLLFLTETDSSDMVSHGSVDLRDVVVDEIRPGACGGQRCPYARRRDPRRRGRRRRPGPPWATRVESPRQRPQVHAGRGEDHGLAPQLRDARGADGHRHRNRHCAGASAAGVRPVLPGRQGAVAGRGRYGSGLVDRSASRRGARRPGARAERARRGHYLRRGYTGGRPVCPEASPRSRRRGAQRLKSASRSLHRAFIFPLHNRTARKLRARRLHSTCLDDQKGREKMNTIKLTLLLASLTGMLVLIGGQLGGTGGMVIALGFAVVMNLGTYWFSDKLALGATGAKEVTYENAPELHRIVDRLATQGRMPKPRVYIVESQAPNAFATGRGPDNAAVAVTTGLLQMLSRDELAGVIAHELAHVRNRDTLISAVVATIAGAITMIANMAQWALMFGGLGRDDEEGSGLAGLAGSLVMIFVAPIAALLIQLAISRSREFTADETGARIMGDPLPLASALEKLHAANRVIPMQVSPATAHQFTVQPLAGGGLMGLFSTHPNIEERVARLRDLALRPMAYQDWSR